MAMGEKGRTVHVGVIGLGGRGCGQMKTVLQMPDVIVDMVCDVYEDRTQKGVEIVKEVAGNDAVGTQDYRDILKNPDIEAVFIFSSWAAECASLCAPIRNTASAIRRR